VLANTSGFVKNGGGLGLATVQPFRPEGIYFMKKIGQPKLSERGYGKKTNWRNRWSQTAIGLVIYRAWIDNRIYDQEFSRYASYSSGRDIA